MLLGVARHGALAWDYLRAGVRPAAARAWFVSEMKQHDRLALSPSLWVLTDDYHRVTEAILYDPIDPVTKQPYRVICLQQYGFANVARIDGYHEVRSHWRAEKPQLFGLTLANSMPGYQFAIWERDEAPPRPTASSSGK
jgi:hypothetical protein